MYKIKCIQKYEPYQAYSDFSTNENYCNSVHGERQEDHHNPLAGLSVLNWKVISLAKQKKKINEKITGRRT